jgi:tetratricopeptide (TPR) repeat protein
MDDLAPANLLAEAQDRDSAEPPAQAQHDDQTAAAHLERGKTHAAQGDYDLAAADFTQAIRLEPNEPEAFLLRGQVCEKQGEHEQAVADYTAALQIDVNRTLALAQRILALTTRREFDSAVADADQSLRLNQRLANTYFLRGTAYLRHAEWARGCDDFAQVVQLDPANGLGFLRKGEANARLGNQEQAVADFTEAIRLDPNNVAAYNLRGEVLQHQGHHDRAIADFTEALRLDPQYTPARNNRGDAHFRRGHYDEAIADYSQAIYLAPRCVRSYLCRSVARIEKGDYERALADFARAVAIEPRNPFAGENPEAAQRLRAAYDRVLADLGRFKRDLRKAAADFADATGLDVRLGEIFPAIEPLRERERAGEPGASPFPAPAAASRGEENDVADRPGVEVAAGAEPPRSEEADRIAREQRQRAESHYQRGWIFQQQGDLERAHQEYTEAIAADASCADAYLERGQVYRLANQLDDAVSDFTTAIELGAGAEAYLRRANTHTEQSHFDLAFADYREALRLDPDLAAAYVNRGLAHAKMGEFEKAAADADRALRIDPTLTRALFVRGVAHGKRNEHDLALADFDLLLRLEPDNAVARNQRGLVCAARGNYAEAVADCSEALRLAPGFDAALFNRGSAYRLQGDHEAAAADFTEFLRRRPHNAQAYYHRGLAYLGRQEHDAAIADFTHAFQLDPNLHKAYTSCLEATRAKYENQLARAGSQQRPGAGAAAAPGPVNGKAAPGKDETAPSRVASDATLGEAQGTQAGGTKPNPPKRPAPLSKLRVECPECGTEGLLDFRNLDKLFRCPGCETWWRTSAGGDLVKAVDPGIEKGPDPGIEVEVASATGRSKHRVPVAADSPPEPPAKPAKPSKSVKPAPKRRQREGPLRHVVLWIATAARTKPGRWVMAAGVLALLGLIPLVFPSLFPSQLKTRGEKAARAWLARDVEQIKQFVEPSQVELVERWLREDPPPDLAGQEPAPSVNVAVQHNDGRNAVVVIQIKAKKKNGSPAFFVFRHRWVSRDGVWYVEPGLRSTHAVRRKGPKGAAERHRLGRDV